MSDKLNLTKWTEIAIKSAHLEGLPLDRQIEELEKLIPNVNGRCAMNAKTNIIDRALRELKAIRSNTDVETAQAQIDTISLPASYIVDNADECSIVLDGKPVKYVTSYLVKCSDPYLLELKLCLSIPKIWSCSLDSEYNNECQQLRFIDKHKKCLIALDGKPLRYFVSDYSIGRGESDMIELELHLSIPRKEICLDIGTI